MASAGLQTLGLLVSGAGWLCGLVACAAPLWRVSAYVGDELVVAEALWEGLWMTCLTQPGRVQCKAYDSALALTASLQLCRSVAVLALLAGALAVPPAVLGLECTRCLGGARDLKARLVRAAGVTFAIAGGAFLVPVLWTTAEVIRDFHDPAVAPPLKRELGPALYLGGVVTLMMLLGGAAMYQGAAAPGGAPAKVGAVGAPAAAKDNPHQEAERRPEKAFV